MSTSGRIHRSASAPGSPSRAVRSRSARDGRELFFRNGRRYYSAAIAWSGGEIRASRPLLMFEGEFVVASLIPGFPSYDVAPDGRRFIVVAAAADSPGIAQLDVVLGWSLVLEDRVSRQTAK